METFINDPLSSSGTLRDIQIINFFVDRAEVESLVPEQLIIRDFNGKAMISLINVINHRLSPPFFPGDPDSAYRHVAFRLLVDDAALNGGTSKGVFFLKSFTYSDIEGNDLNRFVTHGLEQAGLLVIDNMLELSQGEKFLNYALDFHNEPQFDEQQQLTAQLDRAYQLDAGELQVIKINGKRWPLKPTACYLFETNFFRSAKFAAAFRIDEKSGRQAMSYETKRNCA